MVSDSDAGVNTASVFKSIGSVAPVMSVMLCISVIACLKCLFVVKAAKSPL